MADCTGPQIVFFNFTYGLAANTAVNVFEIFVSCTGGAWSGTCIWPKIYRELGENRGDDGGNIHI